MKLSILFVQPEPASFSLLAGRETQVTVRMSGTRPPAGKYDGFLVISGGPVDVRVPYSFFVGPGAAWNMYALRGSSFDAIPGYEGNTCVKWLRRLKVTNQPNMSREETAKYTDPLPSGASRQFSFVMDAKSIITSPSYPERLRDKGWWPVTDLLKLNGVIVKQLEKDSNISVNVYHIDDYKSFTRPYEKHHKNYAVKVSAKKQTGHFLKGDFIIHLNQPANRYIIEMLEPTGDDSFFAWNFFDAILQQKEGYSDYRWEDIAAEVLKKDPALKEKLEAKKATDTKFAANSSAMLNFIYENSAYYEKAHLRYPVYCIDWDADTGYYILDISYLYLVTATRN